ncbi:hypothetical protein JCM1840_003312 [Sporobolomyces johnsonii]
MQDVIDPAGLGRPSQPAASAELTRAPSSADSLEDYDDLQDLPEGPFRVVEEEVELEEEEEVELAEEQPYWKNPTREGAITRWAMALHKDSVLLNDALSWEAFSSDLSSLRKRSISTSHAYLILPRNFQTVAANPLLRHAQMPRKCWCPLWVPAQQESWEEELREIEREQLKVNDLEEIVERVFEKKHEDGLLESMHEMNWLWFDHTCEIFQLARIKQAYRCLASKDLVDDLWRKITRLGDEHQQELVSAEEKLEHAKRAGASAQVVNDLSVDVKLMQSAWSAREDELKALQKRLLQRLKENTGVERNQQESQLDRTVFAGQAAQRGSERVAH